MRFALTTAVATPPPRSSWWVLALIGGGAGCFGSLLGLGGGVVIVPALAAFAHVPHKAAVGTSLVAATVIGGTSAASYAREGLVDAFDVLTIAGGSMLTASVGARIAQNMSDRNLKTILGVYMLCVAAFVPLRQQLAQLVLCDASKSPTDDVQAGGTDAVKSAEGDRLSTAPIFFAAGLTAGIASGLFGVAGGAIVTPLLAIFSSLSQPQGKQVYTRIPRYIYS